jgi:hypothetical protein
VPECPAVGHGVEGKHLLHAAVAVGRNDENEPVGKSNDDVVMEFALLSVIEELVASVVCAQLFEERSKNERIGELLKVGVHRHRA